ncbi:MAG: succinate dehydrogenase cytochrome b subunit [Nitrospira sp.]|nr:succinate dehydrogenase cytochrome b subunit [Nitrospira sp.]
MKEAVSWLPLEALAEAEAMMKSEADTHLSKQIGENVMSRANLFFDSSMNSKIIVSLTGVGLVGFVIFHMLGNLQVFEGSDAINGYASILRDMPIFLWTARAGLLVAAGFHIGLAIRLALRNRQGRPVAYAVREYRAASISSRTMALTGSLLLLFIVFHLLHLTAGVIDPSAPDGIDEQGRMDVYGKIIHAFSNPIYVGIYVIGQLALGLHLSHAVSSALQTWGIEHAALNHLFRLTGPVVALLVVLGNLSIIFAVFLGLVGA